MRFAPWVAGLEWLVALAWMARSASAHFHLRDLPNLLDDRYAQPYELLSDAPALSVIVPALNEAAAIGECLGSLLASQGLRLEILAVDDRSTDATGAIMDSIARTARRGPHTLRVIHIEHLPGGWLGKPHALALAARQATAPLLLFTDADAFYAPDALARCLRFVEAEQADHLVLLPTPIHKGAGERMMLGAIQALSVWGPRLWKIADPEAADTIGIGCFNLLRREAYEAIGGFEALRMEVLEDLRLGYLVKQCGLRQRVALGQNLLRLHWATGALGIVHVLEKNFFAVCRYRPLGLLAALCGVSAITVAPFAGFFGRACVELPSVVTLLTLGLLYGWNARRTGIPPVFVLLFPMASCLLLYAMARSAAVTLARGGVTWRGTFYPLAELRREAGPLFRWGLRRPG